MDANRKLLPQGVKSLVGSNPVKSRVAGAGSKDFGGNHRGDREGQDKKEDERHIGSRGLTSKGVQAKGHPKVGQLQHTESTLSVWSGVSETSSFTALSAESNEEVEIVVVDSSQEINKHAKFLYTELKTELGKMTKACEKQPNVSKVIKDGIVNINKLIDVYQKTVEDTWSANNECSMNLNDYRDHHEARSREKKEKIEKLKATVKVAAQKKRPRSPEISPEKKEGTKKRMK